MLMFDCLWLTDHLHPDVDDEEYDEDAAPGDEEEEEGEDEEEENEEEEEEDLSGEVSIKRDVFRTGCLGVRHCGEK